MAVVVYMVPESVRKVYRMVSTRSVIKREDIDGRCFSRVGYFQYYLGCELRSWTKNGIYTYDLFYLLIPEKNIKEMPIAMNTTITSIVFVVTTAESYSTFELDSNFADTMWSVRSLLIYEQVKLADLDASKQPVPSYITVSWNTIMTTIAEAKSFLDEDAIMKDLQTAIS